MVHFIGPAIVGGYRIERLCGIFFYTAILLLFNDETDWLIAWQGEARLGGRAKQNPGKKKGGVFRATKDAR